MRMGGCPDRWTRLQKVVMDSGKNAHEWWYKRKRRSGGLGWDHMDCCDLEGEVEGLRGLEIVVGGTLPQ